MRPSSTPAGALSRSALVARLRAAGCVFAEDEAELLLAETDDPATLEAMVRQRVAGLPLEHVLGWAEFCGLRIALEPGVFVPRPRTEALVGQAVTLAPPGAVILDLCCGSGAVGLAVAASVPGARLYASDLDPVAVRTARRNLPAERVFQGDLFEALPGQLMAAIDLLLVIAPYVPSAEIALLPHEARDFEPVLALDGGDDGLRLLRRILGEAAQWLSPQGRLLTEVSQRQAPLLAGEAQRHGFAASIEETVVTLRRA